MLKAIFGTLIISALFILHSYGQDNECKVLLNGLDEQYSGECKKGLAHGEGKAEGSLGKYEGKFKKGFPNGQGRLDYNETIAEGAYYVGSWQKGERDGEGTYYHSKDSITAGYWEDDDYIGKYAYPYKVLSSQAVPRYKFTKTSVIGTPNIQIQFKRQGVLTMSEIITLQVQASSGSESRLQNYVVIENVDFPFEGFLTLSVTNRMKANTYSASFSFVINEEADWIVTIDY